MTRRPKSGLVSTLSAWTLCGGYFDTGQRSDKPATCRTCLEIDNPLGLAAHEVTYLRDVATRGAPYGGVAALRVLVKADFLTFEKSLTRRGKILVEDFDAEPVPMADGLGIMHARLPLNQFSACERSTRLQGTDRMTTEHYAKLRLVQDQLMVTCIRCLAR